MNLPSRLAAFVLAASAISCSQEGPARLYAQAGFMAECTLTPEDIDRFVHDVSNGEEFGRIEAKLAEHECEHGWALRLCEPDFIDSKHAEKCSETVLDRMVAFKYDVRETDCLTLCESFSRALQRSGQLDRALALIDSAISALDQDLPKDMRGSLLGWPASRLAQVAADLCEREGRIDRALDYANRWEPCSVCGTCAGYEQGRIDGYRASLLFKLGRFDQAIATARDLATRRQTWALSLWIDCEIGSGRCKNSESALRVLREALLADSETVAACEMGKRLADLRHANSQVQFDSLSQLAQLDEYWTLPLALNFSEQGLHDRMSAFDVVGLHLRDEPLAEVLAYTGHPDLQWPIDRAGKQLGVDAMVSIRWRWQAANRRVVALSHKR